MVNTVSLYIYIFFFFFVFLEETSDGQSTPDDRTATGSRSGLYLFSLQCMVICMIYLTRIYSYVKKTSATHDGKTLGTVGVTPAFNVTSVIQLFETSV